MSYSFVLKNAGIPIKFSASYKKSFLKLSALNSAFSSLLRFGEAFISRTFA